MILEMCCESTSGDSICFRKPRKVVRKNAGNDEDRTSEKDKSARIRSSLFTSRGFAHFDKQALTKIKCDVSKEKQREYLQNAMSQQLWKQRFEEVVVFILRRDRTVKF